MNTPPKVCNLQFTTKSNQQVLWLDVAVYDVLGMAVGQRTRQAQHIAAWRMGSTMRAKGGEVVVRGVQAVLGCVGPAGMRREEQ